MSIEVTSGVACRFISRMSPPALNEGPSAVRMTQRTLLSLSMRSIATRTSATAVLPVNGLRRSGWFMVSVTTGPLCS